jgi:formylglycine-generating enzyme required for sulfatase activity
VSAPVTVGAEMARNVFDERQDGCACGVGFKRVKHGMKKHVFRILILTAFIAATSFQPAPSAARKKPIHKPHKPTVEKVVKAPIDPPRQITPWGGSPLSAEVEATLRPKDSFKECADCPEMVVVPSGTFIMGTPATEIDRYEGEDPVHRVTIPKPFAVGRFSISFDEWDACLADGGCNGKRGDDHGFGRGRMPAQGISFENAQAYLAWLSKKVGRTYRLPSETEREYFTRAGTTTPFWFGKTVSERDANYDASIPYGDGPRGKRSQGPKPVDFYKPNPFGLYQVHGNIRELTMDCYNKRYTEDTPSDGTPWLDGDCSKRVVRGGQWDLSANQIRSGARDEARVDSEGGFKGFRVVRDLNALR